ncbi:MAG: glycosyltransferase family 39 protein [Planctomycetaceae bacterium]
MPRQPKGTSATAGDQPALTEPDRSKEWMIVLAITFVGVVLRVWQPSHMAVEHFDEGVYASNILCPFNGDRYPFRHLYAPPLLPFILEWTLILSGMAASSVMWVNVIAGCVMVPSVWWVSRQWFGPVAGLTSATLAAFSEVHILFSRSALTDVLLCLWMLWGVYWAWRAILTGRPLAIFLAGLFASLAWWTKYNGWLTLAISGSGTLAWLIVPRITPARFATHFKCAAKRDDTPSPGPVLLRWSLLAAIAILGWLPVLIDLQKYGGYSAVSANHAGYFVGLNGWWESLRQQGRNIALIGGVLTCLALIGCAFIRDAWNRPESFVKSESIRDEIADLTVCFSVMALFVVSWVLSLFSGTTVITFLLAIVGLGTLLIRSDSPSRTLASWITSAWVIGLLVATPMYTPYARLTLPLIVATWFPVGSCFAMVFDKPLGRKDRILAPDSNNEKRTSADLVPGLFVLMSPCLGFWSFWFMQDFPQLWEDRGELRQVASEMFRQVEEVDGAIGLSVIGEPGLFYHGCDPEPSLIE